MKISDVRIRFVRKDDSKLRAVASITIDDCFVVHDIKVIEGADGPLHRHAQPQDERRRIQGYRPSLEYGDPRGAADAILAAYNEALAEAD